MTIWRFFSGGANNSSARSQGLNELLFLTYLFHISLACPQDSRAALPRFAQPGRIGSSSFTFDSLAAAYSDRGGF